jgi:hypothetical protein
MILRFLLLMMTGLSLAACSTTSAPSMKETPASAIPDDSSASARAESQRTLANPDVISASDPGTKVIPSASPLETTVVQSSPSSATAETHQFKFDCTTGTKAMGKVDRWSPLSTCPAGYQVTGLGRIDLLGDHNRPNLHVNDFVCDDRGCKAWCIGDGCTVEARCCRITE